MKKILIFGFGERGRNLIDEYLQYHGINRIVAIVDNNIEKKFYQNILIIKPKDIANFIYDEIWVCTVYYLEIKRQLTEEYGIPEGKIIYVDPVMPILEERLRRRYKNALNESMDISEDLKPLLKYMEYYPARMYCYPFWNEYFFKTDTSIFYDEQNRLFYVYYESKRMYFSKTFNTEQKVRSYYNSILMEQDSRSPHCYWNDERMKNLYGTGLDVGAAEGIFSLKIIDQVEHIYMIEMDKDWVEALYHTFKPYWDKVTIVQKFVSDKDNNESIRLDSLIEEKVDFIKMDIEGEEQKALIGCQNILNNNCVQLAVCVYHKPEDNEYIGNFLEQQGYHINNSEGYVICQGEWELDSDNIDFRKAILFAHKKGTTESEVFSYMHTEL